MKIFLKIEKFLNLKKKTYSHVTLFAVHLPIGRVRQKFRTAEESTFLEHGNDDSFALMTHCYAQGSCR